MTKTKNWFKWSLMGLLLAAATSASAGVVTINPSTGPYKEGDTIVFTVRDDDVSGMCFDGLCFGEFRVIFDPNQFTFMPADGFQVNNGLTSSVTSLLGTGWSVVGGPSATEGDSDYIDVSVLYDGEGAPTGGPADLFSLTFDVKSSETNGGVSISPEFTGGTIPEPASYALVMLAFAAMGGVARRKGRRSA